MATKPTRLQEQACDILADALLRIAEAARLDGKANFGAAEMTEVAARLAKASSAFSLGEIVARALEARGRSLGLRSGTAELLTLLETGITPLDALGLADDAFRGRVAEVEAELGDV